MGWILAIDFGTTATAAAINDGDTQLIDVDGLSRLPSLVMLGEDGVPVVGSVAERQAASAPERVERTPKRRLGDTLVLLGDQPVNPVDLVAAVLRRVVEEARRRKGGTDPDEVVLTHPAAWVGARLAALREAARRAEVGEVTLIPEPVAAAVHLADERITPGDHVAVYDLGGGTFDAAVLRRTPAGFEPVGAPGGDEHLGGEDFDELLYRHVGKLLSARDASVWDQLQTSEERAWVRANGALRTEIRAAKEALSTTTEYTIYVGAPVDQEVRVTREELEDLVRPDLERTVSELLASVERAGLRLRDVAAVYLVGGSSRIPLVGRLVAEATGLVPLTWGDPKAAVALGAAARGASRKPSAVVLGPAAAPIPPTAPAVVATGAASTPASVVPPALPDPPSPAKRATAPTRALVGVAAALVIAMIAVAAVVLPRGDDPTRVAAEGAPPTTIGTDGTLRHTFATSESEGVRAARSWTFSPDDDKLTNELVITNTTPDARTSILFEVIPKEVAADVGAVTFDPSPAEVVQPDPVVRYDLPLEAAGQATLRWVVIVADELDIDALAALATKRDEADRAFHEQQAALVAAAAPAAAGSVLGPQSTNSTAAPSSGGTPTTRRSGGATQPPPAGGGSATTAPPSANPTGSSDTTAAPAATTTTAGASISAPGAVASLQVGNPVATRISNGVPEEIAVTLTWSPPANDGGQAPSSYKIRCTLMKGSGSDSTVYTPPTGYNQVCVGGVDIATVGGSARSADVVTARVDSGPLTWIKWEVSAVNGAGTGPRRTATVIVPNVVGLYSWEAYPLSRAVGLSTSGATSSECTTESVICKQGIAPETESNSGANFVVFEKPPT